MTYMTQKYKPYATENTLYNTKKETDIHKPENLLYGIGSGTGYNTYHMSTHKGKDDSPINMYRIKLK